MPKTDCITRLRVRDFRVLADVTIELGGLTVLIGENGSGKSSIVEICEILRALATPGSSLQAVLTEHPRAVRAPQTSFVIEARIEGQGPPLDYRIAIERTDSTMGVVEEMLQVGPTEGHATPSHPIARTPGKSLVFDQTAGRMVKVGMDSSVPLLSVFGYFPPREGGTPLEQQAIVRAARALRSVEAHLPFDVMPYWAARQLARRSAIREASTVQPASRLELLAGNLANVFMRLKNEFGGEHWRETMDYVRLGLGDDIDEVGLVADAGGGQHALAIRYRSLGAHVPAAALSDGTLAYLSFVALFRLPSTRSLLVFDEPELHLHPALVTRVVSMLEAIGRTCPVIVATHSDRVLDALTSPAESAILCELDAARAARLIRPDKTLLERWLADFRGLGDLRAAGLESAVMPPRESTP